MLGRHRHPRDPGMSPVTAGLIALVVIVVGSYFGFTKANPFAQPFELQAVFESSNDLKPRSFVRIAGVNVGRVKKVEAVDDSGAARVTMEIEEKGLPIHTDAELKIRPHLFLEGNFFVDLRPGSPSEPAVADGATIPSNQTATPVQFGQLLAALQSDTRRDLQVLLEEYSEGLRGRGAEGWRELFLHSESAYRNSALANDASLGTRTHDLSRLLRGQQRTFRALARHEESLKDLITNFNVTAAAFAREDVALEATIPELRDVLRVGPPALRSLNASLPSLRAFARDALPATRSSEPTLDASLPFIQQARRLVSRAELRGLVAKLRGAIPDLARLNVETVPFLEEGRALSACQSQVLVPFATTPIPDPDFPTNSGEPFYKQAPRGLVGLSGESRLSDANSPMFRVQFGGGPTTIVSAGDTGEKFFGQALFPILGTRPARPNRRPDFRPGTPCETQEPPNLAAPVGAADEAVNPNPTPAARAANRELNARIQRDFQKLVRHMRDQAAGRPTIDPLQFSDRGLRREARRRGLKPLSDGGFVRVKEGGGR